MIDKFDKNDGLRIFSFTVFAVLIINLLYSMLLTVFPSLDGEAGFWCVNVILQASLAGVVALYCKSKNISFFSAASLDVKPRVADVFLTMGAGAGTLAFMLPLQNFIVNWFEWMGFEVSVSVPVTGTAGNVVLLIVVACIMPAFCEELVFRGALGNGLAETGLWSASLLGGALFSLFHMNPAQTLHQFVMGFLLVFYILVTGSFWCSFAAHLFNNLLTVVLSLTLGEKNRRLEHGLLVYIYTCGRGLRTSPCLAAVQAQKVRRAGGLRQGRPRKKLYFAFAAARSACVRAVLA